MYYNIRRFVEPVIPTRKQLCKAARRHIVLEDLSADDKCNMHRPPPGPPPSSSEDLPPPCSSNAPPGSSSISEPPPWQPNFIDLTSQSHRAILSNLRKPLDPPPDCFSTPSPLRVKSHDFPPFRISSLHETLGAGFRILYPSDLLEKHGIGQADWVRFLEDLGMAARLAGQGLSAVGSRVPVTPLPTRGIFSSRASGVAYDSQFVRTPKDEVQALITVWNQSAFERRKLRVSMHPKGDGGAKTGWELLVESL
ncbi:hypothetical protein SERLADRAFT_418542 [Serpula lacrymans var. lacrymans S7.9]|uniref:Uncharacterized protein n=1 Tax=Serpula lacrymans var. lacrymans (strain S7.9) TaxID=578457 RepID=F8PC86_SERL9|nr:uncharacterized protein SERLADRAFT_418542 [Serpula lacrymans var. lacrymans S7.9]EGO19286.1 hypothetical protein SERLADRAFT_418542 [Serpula lacrymans var. lacrymans S7.9]